MTDLRLARDESDLAACFAIRTTVFIVEQGVPEEIERDALDQTADHLLAHVAGVPVGTARLVPPATDEVAVIGRVAVLPGFRERGIGRALVAAAEAAASGHGARRAELHAQLPVRDFYARLGYLAVGAEFMEAGIPHVSMVKELG